MEKCWDDDGENDEASFSDHHKDDANEANEDHQVFLICRSTVILNFHYRRVNVRTRASEHINALASR